MVSLLTLVSISPAQAVCGSIMDDAAVLCGHFVTFPLPRGSHVTKRDRKGNVCDSRVLLPIGGKYETFCSTDV